MSGGGGVDDNRLMGCLGVVGVDCNRLMGMSGVGRR